MLLDRRFPLTVEGRIEQSELPPRRRTACHDPVPAAVEVEIFAFVSNIVKGRHTRTDMEVHMGQEAVLCNMKANTDRTGIAFANLKVDIAHGGIKRARVCVHYSRCRRDSAG